MHYPLSVSKIEIKSCKNFGKKREAVKKRYCNQMQQKAAQKREKRGLYDFEAEFSGQKEGEQRIRCSWKMNAVIN